jgi:hypothetical protein
MKWHGEAVSQRLIRARLTREMPRHSYIIHRASKMAPPSRLELYLIDRYFEETGVRIPWSPLVTVSAHARSLVCDVMKGVLDAA